MTDAVALARLTALARRLDSLEAGIVAEPAPRDTAYEPAGRPQWHATTATDTATPRRSVQPVAVRYVPGTRIADFRAR